MDHELESPRSLKSDTNIQPTSQVSLAPEAESNAQSKKQPATKKTEGALDISSEEDFGHDLENDNNYGKAIHNFDTK